VSTASGPLTVRASDATRWGQLVFGIICMVMTANLQYGWTLFVTPIDNKYHWGRASIQVAFSIFVLAETWLVPFEGYLIDKFGPKLMVGIAGGLIAIAWAMNAYADSLTLLYVGAVIGGVGAGIIYGASVGNALKWFPDRRGLAAGLTAAGFGAGSALTIVPIANLIKSDGYEVAFLWFGLGQGLVVMLVALLLRAPEAGEVPVPAAPAVQQTRRDYGPQEVLKTPVFWVMYLMFVLVGAGGLMATAQLAPIAKDFRVDNIPVSILGLTLPALTFALSIDRVLNGICRPFFGWCQITSAARTRCLLPSCSRASASTRYFSSQPTRSGLLCYLAWCSSPGGRSTRCSRRPALTSMDGNSLPRTTACFTPRRALHRFWCRLPMFSLRQPAVGARCSL
jgi:MFS transporter, OFA family, oxalate/formate antiporter